MFKKIGFYYRTIKHLKPIQVRYRLWYMLRNKIRKLTGHSYSFTSPQKSHSLKLEPGIHKPSTVNIKHSTFSFTFLNQSHTFKEAINWNFTKFGKLWTYNLNYFDYLGKENITKEDGLKLIRKFIDQMDTNHEGLESYPISLRGINWIKFLNKHQIKDEKMDAGLYAQYQILLDNLEYHLMGNHLLENGCSLLFGAYYFTDKKLWTKAEKILTAQLKEQILGDGGHFERSTMYHSILLERLMDCYNLVSNNDTEWNSITLENQLQEVISRMLGWMEQLAVDSGQLAVDSEMPLLNDAALGIGPSVNDLLDYAQRLGLQVSDIKLSESGYRRYPTERIDLICDVGNIGPDYIPGHAHSDTLSFILYIDGKPFIIDPGISTYENNQTRFSERSTAFHNTVMVDNEEQSEVWSAFRVGRKAKVQALSELDNKKDYHLSACHDGYKHLGLKHTRSWILSKQKELLEIKDTLKGKDAAGKAYLHFSPTWNSEWVLSSNTLKTKNIRIEFEHSVKIEQEIYNCPNGYNKYLKGSKIIIYFKNYLLTRVKLV